MREVDEKSIIELAKSHRDPHEFIKIIYAKYGYVPVAERGSLAEQIGTILYQSSLINHALCSWSKYYEKIKDLDGEENCYTILSIIYYDFDPTRNPISSSIKPENPDTRILTRHHQKSRLLHSIRV